MTVDEEFINTELKSAKERLQLLQNECLKMMGVISFLEYTLTKDKEKKDELGK